MAEYVNEDKSIIIKNETDSDFNVGHWIFIHPLQDNDSGAYICSECKIGDWDINPVEDKECKFCGARMEGEVNG